MNKSVVEKSLLCIKDYTERVCASRNTENTRKLREAVNALIGEFNTYDYDYALENEANALRELLIACFLKELPIGITLEDVLGVPVEYYKRRMFQYSSLGIREAFLQSVKDYKYMCMLATYADDCREYIQYLSKMVEQADLGSDSRDAYEHARKTAEETLIDLRNSISELYS